MINKIYRVIFFLMMLPSIALALNLSEKITNVLYGTGISLVEDYRGISISIPTDNMFLHDRAEDPRIDPHYFYVLDAVVNVLEHYTEGRDLEITAHTDDLWTRSREKLISRSYADAVAVYIVSRGVDGRRIKKVLGRGSDEPVANNRFFGGRILNRRVEILLLPPKDYIFEEPVASAPEPEEIYEK